MLCVLFQLRIDRDSAVQASASAYQAGELLRDQLSLVTRERDIAQAKVSITYQITNVMRLC